MSTGAGVCELFVLPPERREPAMSIHVFKNSVFDPEAVKALVAAFDDACAALHLDRNDPSATLVARKIIEHARHGKRDPIRLREAVLAEVRAAADAG